MKVVILSKDESEKAKEILYGLRFEGIPVQAVVSEIRKEIPLTPARIVQKIREYSFGQLWRKGLGKALRLPSRDVQKLNKNETRAISLSAYSQKEGAAYFRVPDLNGAESIDLLKQLGPDLLILGGTGIIRRGLLDIPRIGTVNAHMGLLPKYRGMNVTEWSALNNDPVGVTVHFVDEGVDTGEILYREIIDVTDCPSIERLRAKVSRRQHQILAECVRMFIDGKEVHPIRQEILEGKQYYAMHERLKERLEEKLHRMFVRGEAAQRRQTAGNFCSSGGR